MIALASREQVILGALIGGAVLLVLLVDAVLLMAWIWVREEVAEGRRPPLFARTWSLLDPWIGGQIAAFLTIGVGLALMPFMAARSGARGADLPMGYVLAVLCAQNIVLTGVTVYYVYERYRASLGDVGLSWPPRGRHVALGLGGGVLLLLAASGAERTLADLFRSWIPTHYAEMLRRITDLVNAEAILRSWDGSLPVAIALVLVVGVVAPFGEEMFFRAFLHNCARRRLGRPLGTAVSAAVFAAVHVGPMQVPVIFLMGVVLAVVYDRTGSLWVPFLMHATNNAVVVAVLLAAPHLLP